MTKVVQKRKAAPSANVSRKKRKTTPKTAATAPSKSKSKTKTVIPIPQGPDENEELSDENFHLLDEYGTSISFLSALDSTAIARSKAETLRLKELSKTPRKSKPALDDNDDDLPPINSSEEDDEADWDSDSVSDTTSISDLSGNDQVSSSSENEEKHYERVPRSTFQPSKRQAAASTSIRGLPIKLADGRIQATGKETILANADPQSDSDSEQSISSEPHASSGSKREGVETAARFGRAALTDVLSIPSRKTRLIAAKNQIAGICQDIVSDPENGLGLLRRLHSFSLTTIKTPTTPEGVANDIVVRRLAIVSQLAVFKDIIPGYRIRELTEKEKQEKVSQMVARTREYEQGLVSIYQTYLLAMEAEIKGQTELASTCLNCMCTLLKDVTHFNFRTNLMNRIVSKLGKKSWDESSQLCLDAIIHVFQNDLQGQASLELVQLVNRMVKEKHYRVHPGVLSALLHLRLRNELDIRASSSRVEKGIPKRGSSKPKPQGKQPHLSKKAKKALKEQKEIQKEFKEAEAEVDKEERANRQTETLKLLFVLYFQILKQPKPTVLLPAALQGISKFAHLVNVDFFKDLLRTLKTIIQQAEDDNDKNEEDASTATMTTTTTADPKQKLEYQLLCIITAFELLSGQGESLTVDLSDFISHLYKLLHSPTVIFTSSEEDNKLLHLIFQALHLIFAIQPRSSSSMAIVSSSSSSSSSSSHPAWRSAAFCKRLLAASLHWPPQAIIRSLDFTASLLTKDSKLHILLESTSSSEIGHGTSGFYRPDVDDPQLANALSTTCVWELQMLAREHYDDAVKTEAGKLVSLFR